MLKKFLLLILIIFTLSGCTMSYDININKDLSVDQEFILGQNRETIELFYSDKEEYLTETINKYSNVVDFKKYNYEYYDSDNNYIYYKLKRKSDIESFIDESAVKLLFKNVSINNIDGKYEIKISEFIKDLNYNEYDLNNLIDSFALTINSRYKIVKSNADKKNIFLGEYVWEFDSSKKDKEIILTIEPEINKISEFYLKNKVLCYIFLILFGILIIWIVVSIFEKLYKKINAL